MTARDELQQWVEGGSWADQGYESELIPVDLARRVLAEMDEAHTWNGVMALLDEHYPTSIFPHLAGRPDYPERDPGPRILSLVREVNRLRTERDAALAKLDAVRAWTQNGEAYIRGGQRKELFRILDGEGDA